MALNGNLDELPILDILQVVAFSRKTGNLQVEGRFGQGGVVFKDGLIHYAYSPTTIDFLRNFRGEPRSEEHQTIILEQIQIALRELVSLRDGTFEFELTPDLPKKLNGNDAQSIYLDEGIDTQRLLLNLVKEMDEDRRETSALLESAFDEDSFLDAAPAGLPPGPEPLRAALPHEDSPCVVLVDDEDMVTGTLAVELRSRGYEVQTASGPAEGLAATRSLTESGKKVLLVTDLRMPTTTGRSFFGGFEIVRTLRREGCRVPVLLMTEKWPPKVRARAKKLGIRHVAFKPALSKLDAKQYGADLRSFARSLDKRLQELATVNVDSKLNMNLPTMADRSAHLLDFLTSMTERLMNPAHKGDISKMVLLVASKYLERGILFLIKRHEARGLSGFGLADSKKANSELAQRLSFDIHEADRFAEVVHSRSTRRCRDPDTLKTSLFQVIGQGRTRECILIPILNNREVQAILYGDNNVTGKPLGKLRGLELFIAQAGIALENLSLHRKLDLFQSKLFSQQEKMTKG